MREISEERRYDKYNIPPLEGTGSQYFLMREQHSIHISKGSKSFSMFELSGNVTP